jgi:hypothetical protein
MYYDRVLSPTEELYISRAQQRIAELGKDLSQGFVDNDVPFTAGELIIELQYSIESIRSTFLVWDDDEIAMVMDYYTLRAGLAEFAFRSIDFNQTPIDISGNWATVPQLEALREESEAADAALQAQIDALVLVDIDLQAQIDAITAGANDATLLREITAGVNVGNIVIGQVFPVGTELTAMWESLLGAVAGTNTLSFDTHVSIVEVLDTLTVSQFTWNVSGSPQNLKLSDNKGILTNEPVTGASYVPPTPIDYDFNTNEEVIWTLSGDNVPSITINVNSYYKSYFGKNVAANDTPISVTEAMILAGTPTKIVETSGDITLLANTSATEQGFIAVPQTQTGRTYTDWFVDTINSSIIAADNFIIPPQTVMVNGIPYDVYRWGYRSPLTDNLRLY